MTLEPVEVFLPPAGPYVSTRSLTPAVVTSHKHIANVDGRRERGGFVAKQPVGSTISAAEARVRFSEMIRRALVDRETIVVESDGIPSVVILSVSQYEELVRDARLARFERSSRAAGLDAEAQGVTEEQLEAEMEETRQRHYRRAYG